MHFSDARDNYWNTFKYIIKSDPNIFLSSNHPNMQDMKSPKAKVCVQAIRQKLKSRSTGDQVSTTTKPRKTERLSDLEVSDSWFPSKKIDSNSRTFQDVFSLFPGLFASQSQYFSRSSDKIPGLSRTFKELYK